VLRTSVVIDGQKYPLAQGQDLEAIKSATVAAAREGAGLVDFVVVGNRAVSVLVTPTIRVMFEEHEVDGDARDNGDLRAPFTSPVDDLDF
jgi:hypothetical protein